MTHTLLLEVGIEDMPANVIQNTEKQFAQKVADFLEENRITFSKIDSFSTPRRFAVKVYEVAAKQENMTSIVRGPAKNISLDEEGNWTPAAIGFSKGQQATVEDIVFKEESGKEYSFIEKYVEGEPTAEILKNIGDVIAHMEFNKNMKWATYNYQYVRPIHWIVALLDDQIIPFEVFNVKTSNKSQGHRFLGTGEIVINHANQYEELMLANKVQANRQERKENIANQIKEVTDKNNWEYPNYPDLLDEVTDLNEWPTVFVAKFNPEFLEVFDVILETSMINHQRYFPVKSIETGELLPYFIGVRNGGDRNLEEVAQGNEKVLAARLADAQFFYKEDQKVSYDEWNNKLKHLDLHDRLGTIYEKEQRVKEIVSILADNYELSAEEKNELKRAAEIYKTDLVSEVVNEFTELQGRIGGQYALERGESPQVAKAIAEQYLPTSMNGELPSSKVSSQLSIADKLDTLIQFFAADMIPTGSNDPFALRRQAMGVIRIVMNLEQSFDLLDTLEQIVENVSLKYEIREGFENHKEDLMAFMLDRVDQYLRENYQLPHDIILASRNGETMDIVEKAAIAHTLHELSNSENYETQIQSLKRVLNITKSAVSQETVQEQLFETNSEKELFTQITLLEEKWDENATGSDHIKWLCELSTAIDGFFDDNMVMVEEEDIRNNRLAMLNRIATLANSVADFSELVI